MRPVEIRQDEIRITQHQPDNVVIEMNSNTITLTAENTELLRVMLYEAYRSKRWKYSRAEKSARNKAFWAIAKAQGKSKPDTYTEKVYERMQEQATQEVEEIDFEVPDFDYVDKYLKDLLNDET